MRDLRRVRQHLSLSNATLVANALVTSRLDYCNSLYRSLSRADLKKLQCIQNSLARIVTKHSRYSHITPVLRSLHWLPIQYRSMFKTAMLVYKFLHSGLPHYFSPYLSPYTSSRDTRRSRPEKGFLSVPNFLSSVHKSKCHFNNTLAYDAPTLWNGLPLEIRSASSLACFRKKLKSYLFDKAFPP